MEKDCGLDTSFVRRVAELPTGIAKVQKDARGNGSFEISRPAAFDVLQIDSADLERLCDLAPEWIYFGTLAQTCPQTEALLQEILTHLPKARRFYDVNLRRGHWHLPLVERLASRATVLKLNEEEAQVISSMQNDTKTFSLIEFCRRWSEQHGPEIVCVTRGEMGCSIWADGRLTSYGGYAVRVADTVGAGDAFSAAFLHGLGQGWPMEQVAARANAAGALVASRVGAMPLWSLDECLELIAGHRFAENTNGNCARSM